MPLISLEELAPDLGCPSCGAALEQTAGQYRCQCGRAYSTIEGQPVLVDFDDSVLVEEEVSGSGADSTIERGHSGRLKRGVARALLPRNRVAAANAERFLGLARMLADRPSVLIVGGGSRGEGTEALYEDSEARLIAFDIYRSDLTQFVADAHHIPLADGSIDAIWIQAVLEHVLDPPRVVAELHRVLKPGGIVYAETPFLQQVHEGAYDFTRFTESGHRWLFRAFEEVDSGVVLGVGSQLIWSIEHLARGTFRSVRAGIAAKMAFFWLGYFDRIIPRTYASDAASAVYFLGRRSGQPMKPKDMVAYYKGAHARRG